jgi:CheY-like chemotaxis protein
VTVSKILVIDDDPDFVEVTRIVLEAEGHQVIAASSGDEGFQRTVDEQPDLVILDVIMDTVLDGLSTSHRMHDDPVIRHVPVIMVTSIASTDYASLFPTDEYVHVSSFMSKPITPKGLLREVNRALQE